MPAFGLRLSDRGNPPRRLNHLLIEIADHIGKFDNPIVTVIRSLTIAVIIPCCAAWRSVRPLPARRFPSLLPGHAPTTARTKQRLCFLPDGLLLFAEARL